MIQTYAQPNSLEDIFNQVNNKPVVQPAQSILPNYNNPFSQNSFINKNNYLGPAANSTPMLPPLTNEGFVTQPTNVPVTQPVATTPVVKPTVQGTQRVTSQPVSQPVVAPTTVTPTAVPGSTQDAIVKAGLYNDYLTPQERQTLNDTQAYQTSVATQVLDPNAEFQNSLKNYQSQIDSINSMYADRINQARIQGQGRIQSRQFAQGRSGQIGSGVGEAGINAVQDANTQVENSIRSEQANAIADVYSKVRSGAETSLAAKTLAKQQGADALVKHLQEKPGKIKEATASAVAELLSRGVDVANMTPEEVASFTSGLGVSKEQLTSEFKAQSKILEASKVKEAQTQAKADAELAKTKADTEKILSDTANWGKLTEYQKGQLQQQGIKNAQDYKLAKDKATSDRAKTKSEIDVLVNTSVAGAQADGQWDNWSKDERERFIRALGGLPSAYEI